MKTLRLRLNASVGVAVVSLFIKQDYNAVLHWDIAVTYVKERLKHAVVEDMTAADVIRKFFHHVSSLNSALHAPYTEDARGLAEFQEFK